jgi:hypothetical protein
MGDQLVDDRAGVGRLVDDQVHHTRRHARVLERRGDRGVGTRALLGGFEHHGVAVRQRRRHGAGAEDHRRVPRRDPEHHAGRLAHAHREQARDVGRDHLADQAVRLGGRLAEHPGGERAVEHAPSERAAGLLGHDRRDLLRALLEHVGGASEQRAALGDVDQLGNASAAASAARRASSGPAAATVLAATPSTGPELSQDRPELAGTHSPPISSRCCSSSTVAICLSLDSSTYSA